ncbi:MAG: DUF502 domain-containing protein [Puniceicoccales bacterium]|jgi:uncharacterized membrane protein|nr:DUF502 domain-containing protein [Puniceicoccales bacterium]
MLRSLKKSFITGLVLTLPIGITLFFVDIMLRHIGEPASRVLFYWLDVGLRDTSLVKVALGAISIVLVVLIIVAIGFLSHLFLGRLLISTAEKFINHVPFVSTVYKTVKQITETFSKSNKSAFSKTVLIEYPKDGCYAIGFLSSEAEGEVQDRTGEVVVNVFVPTTPNPTSGFLLMVPKNKTTVLDMSVTDGMKLIISGGIVVPPYRKKQRKDRNG